MEMTAKQRKAYNIKVEPYWNVNILFFNCYIVIPFIKVEPYWNVNLLLITSDIKSFVIKVEPYWNVN